jgi:iron complex outermembrane receptor protein
VISENVGRVVVTTGAGDLATPSNSNLGGTVETFSADPLANFGVQVAPDLGSYEHLAHLRAHRQRGVRRRQFGLYLGRRQHARAWDFNGVQGGWQANAKFVHDDDRQADALLRL